MRRALALGRQPAAHRAEAPRRGLPQASNACRQHVYSFMTCGDWACPAPARGACSHAKKADARWVLGRTLDCMSKCYIEAMTWPRVANGAQPAGLYHVRLVAGTCCGVRVCVWPCTSMRCDTVSSGNSEE
jgi:hypothetical protein